jgi:hypothetical protein
VAKLMQANLPPELQYEAFTGAAGEGFATELVGFLDIYRTLPDIDRILTDPHHADVPQDPATLFALCGALSKKADPFTFQAITAYGRRMPEEFCVMLVTDCITRCPDVQETVAFVDWAKNNNHVLV